MNFLEKAQPLLERGFSVIPLRPGAKDTLPGIGAKSRTRDIVHVREWAEQYPDANVAIVADEEVAILESDDFERLAQTIKLSTGETLPITLTACGSSPNRPHLFFKHTEKSRKVGCIALPGLFEARFVNQYVVGPGSVHPDGSLYRFLNDAPIVEIPDWLTSELARLALTQKAERRNPTVQANGPIQQGERHYFRFAELGRAWDGRKTEAEMLAIGLALNERCDPPDSEAKVLSEIRDIMRRTPFDPGPAVLINSVKAEPEAKRRSLTLKELDAEIVSSKSLEELVTGMLPARGVNIVGGDSGLGKSPLLCQLAVCVAAGLPFLGHDVKKGQVLIADYENDYALSGMLHSVARAVKAPPSFQDNLLILQRASAEEVIGEVERTDARLVVVDSLRGFDSLAESKPENAGKVINSLQTINTCWLLIHHLRKQKSEMPRPDLNNPDVPLLTWLENLSGHRSLVNQTFTRLAVDRSEKKAADLILRGYFKGRGEFGPFHLDRIYDEVGEPIGFAPLTGMAMLTLNQKADLQKVVALGRPISFAELTEALGAKSSASRLLGICRSAGLVQNVGTDRRDRRYQFRQAEDGEGNA